MIENSVTKLPISAIVVGLNEAHLLKNSLPKINFCDEILYFDLESTDNSVKIAKLNGARVIKHEKVPGCEWIHAEQYQYTKHNWILITDPDELITDYLIEQINNQFLKDYDQLSNAGCIMAPLSYYFKKQKLKGTVWGGIKYRTLLVHKQKFDFMPVVHLGRKLKDGYESFEIPYNGKNAIQHYWMNSYGNLIRKHIRYLKNEGEARFKNSQRTSLKELALAPIKSFRNCFFLAKGYKDGFTGLFLSLFWSWYETSALIRLYSIQIKQSAKN